MELNCKLIILILSANIFLTSTGRSNEITELENALNIKTEQKISKEKTKPYQLIYFWATWCPDCKEKLKTDLWKYETDLVNFSTFSIEKDKEKIQNFAEKTKLPYPVYFDENKLLQKRLKIFSVPTIVLARIENSDIKVIKQVSGKDWPEINQEISKLTNQGVGK